MDAIDIRRSALRTRLPDGYGFRVWLRFDDGVQGEIDLSAELEGDVFSPLRDRTYFAKFAVDETLIWPNGADFAPEFLYATCRAVGDSA